MKDTSWLLERLRSIPVIDTHEHLWGEEYRLAHPGDWSMLFYHYAGTLFHSAGMSERESGELYHPETPHGMKWGIFNRYFPLCRNAAYIQSVLVAIRDIYGIDRVDADSMEELSRKMAASVTPGFHRRVLRELGGIDYCMVNCFDRDENNERYPARFTGDTELLRPDLFADGFVYPVERRIIERITGVDTSAFSGWLAAVDRYFESYAKRCASIKVAAAYRGSLDFERCVPFRSAEYQYEELLKTGLEYRDCGALRGYLFHRILDRAADCGLPVKFHTGLHSGDGYTKTGEMELNVRHMAKLAAERPECRLVAMHIAYPFQDELVMAIKQTPNLYAEMSWVWVVDPVAAARFLRQALAAAPMSKVLGFGGDYSFVENTYGHLQVARAQMANALGSLIEDGLLDRDGAVEAGRFLLRGSAEKLFPKV